MRSKNGQTLINVLGIAAAFLTFYLVLGLTSGYLLHEEPVFDLFRMNILPILQSCLAAAAGGAVLGFCLRTDRPGTYAMVLAGVLAVYGITSWTIYSGVRWQDVAWVVLSVAMPALVAGLVAFWLARWLGGRRRPEPLAVAA